MKIAGWCLLVFGVLAFIGAYSKGHSVYGPIFWSGVGIFLVYLSNKRQKDKDDLEKWGNS